MRETASKDTGQEILAVETDSGGNEITYGQDPVEKVV